MKYRVEVYYKGGGYALYMIPAHNEAVAKIRGHELSTKWEPNYVIKKVVAKKIDPEPVKLYSSNPDKPFGDPGDNAEDLASHPRAKRYA